MSKTKKLGLFIGAIVIVVVLAVVTSLTVLIFSGKVPARAQGLAVITSTANSDQVKEFGPILETGEYTVNLQGDANFVKLQVSLELTDKKAEEKLKTLQPIIRNQVIDVLAAKSFDQIKNPTGKDNLRKELQTRINDTLGQPLIKSVLFTNYVYQ